MRVLITGISGFAGRHLAGLLKGEGHDVYGTVRTATSGDLGPAGKLDAARIHVADVLDADRVAKVLTAVRPQRLFHLAGAPQVGGSFANPAEVFAINALGTVNVLAAVKKHAPDCRVVVVGSGDAYGRPEDGTMLVDERCPFRPLSPYATSKAAADIAAFQWAQGAGLDVIRVRPFNHIGPGQKPGFACPDFARQLVAIERGERAPTIAVGNLDAVRDFTDVRDVVAAYSVAAEQGQSAEAYNVCSGRGRSVRNLLEDLVAVSGVKIEQVQSVAEQMRTSDVPVLIGSAEKLHAATGWRPCYEWRQTLCDVIDDWRRRP